MASKAEVAPTQETGEGRSTSDNGSGPDIGLISVWSALSERWRPPLTVKREFKKALGEKSVIRDKGVRFYLISPEAGKMILERSGMSFLKIKNPLARDVARMGLTKMAIAGFDISEPDAEGNKSLSLNLDSSPGREHPQELRDDMLSNTGLGGLKLPDVDMTIEIGRIVGDKDGQDFQPFMDEYMPAGKEISFTPPLLDYRPPQASA